MPGAHLLASQPRGRMERLASPIVDLQPHYDVIVVGSGYGASVVASRLARSADAADPKARKLSICILERGLEFQPGEYPDTLWSAFRQIQCVTPGRHFGPATGLYDIRLYESV